MCRKTTFKMYRQTSQGRIEENILYEKSKCLLKLTDKLLRTEWGDTAAHYAARHGAVCMLK